LFTYLLGVFGKSIPTAIGVFRNRLEDLSSPLKKKKLF